MRYLLPGSNERRVSRNHVPAMRRAALLLLALPCLSLACSDESSGSYDGAGGSAGTAGTASSDTGGTGGTPGAGAGGSSGASGGGAAGVTGTQVRLHVKATTAAFNHTDGLSGQTPIDHRAGLRRYRIFKDAADTVGVTVFDLGNDFVEVSYNDKADTLVATVPLDSLPEGTYTRGELVHTHVRYKVNATAHNAGLTAPGTFDNVQVMSNNTTLDGTTYQSGHYRYVFEAAGVTFPKEGEGAPIPEQTSIGGFGVKFVNGEWIYEFPATITIVHGLTKDVDTTMELNMHESFRWQDQDTAGYTAGVFDVTATSFEPVKQFGANSFKVTLGE